MFYFLGEKSGGARPPPPPHSATPLATALYVIAYFAHIVQPMGDPIGAGRLSSPLGDMFPRLRFCASRTVPKHRRRTFPHSEKEKWRSLSYAKGCLHDTGMTFIPERVHTISIYSSVSVHMIPRRNFVPVQVIPE